MTILGEKVKQLRTGRDWTLKDLAKRTGLSQSHISAIESSQRPNPSFQCVARLAAAFEVPISDFADPDWLQTEKNPAMAEGGELLLAFLQLYDRDTQQFIASESSRPYVAFAKQLAENQSVTDAAHILQLIAQFLREQKQPYQVPE